MGRRCGVCSRPDAGAINAALTEGRSARSVAIERSLSEDAVQRHASRHLVRPTGGAPMPASVRTVPAAGVEPLDELVDALRTQALAGNPAIVHQYRLALQAQADGKHAAPPTHDIVTDPAWLALRLRLLLALDPFPDAIAAVRVALQEPDR